VRQASQLKKGDPVRVRVGDGAFSAKVVAVFGATPQLALPLAEETTRSPSNETSGSKPSDEE